MCAPPTAAAAAIVAPISTGIGARPITEAALPRRDGLPRLIEMTSVPATVAAAEAPVAINSFRAPETGTLGDDSA
jgi:hypothetical protein